MYCFWEKKLLENEFENDYGNWPKSFRKCVCWYVMCRKVEMVHCDLCMSLSYDNVVFQGIISCNKKYYDHTFFNILSEILSH